MPVLRRHDPLRVLIAAIAVVAAVLGGAGPARAGGFRSLIGAGGVRLPAHARDLRPLAGSTTVTATVALTPRDPAALAAYAAAVSTPGSPDDHHYLSVAQFRRRFAPPNAQLRRVRAQLRARGLRPGPLAADGLAIPVRASAAVASTAFATTLDRYELPDGASGVAATTPIHLGAIAHLVSDVVGLDTVAPSASASVGAPAGPQPCAAARAQAAQNGSYTPNQIAAQYGLSNFYAAGDEGRGVTIALYELEPFSQSDITAFQSCMGTSASVTTEAVDGGAGTGPGSGEAAMDVEDLIGLAPQASIRVYEGPQTGVGAYDTYSRIVSDDAAQVISTSWGLCEALQGTAAAAAENTLLQEAAVQGQSFIAASGDEGANDCGNGQRAVDDPASQPWATAVGGSSLRNSADSVWDDALGAGGGGVSQLWPEPSYQAGAAQPQSAVTCAGGATACREVPDLVADADPDTGYTAYYRGAWHTVGGTSASSPTVAALAALADASPACGGRPLGFLNPALYAAASSAYAADFRDVTTGANSFGGVLGYAAGAGYDMASGLGTPTSGLGPALCHDAVTLTTPPTQSWSTARAVALSLSATSQRGARISWSAAGLPAGLTLAAGRITGTPTAAGRFTITVTALDADGATATVSFAATVVAPASASGSGSTGAGTRGSAGSTSGPIAVGRLAAVSSHVGTTVRLQIHATDQAGRALRYAAANLPAGLKIDRRSGLIAGTLRVAQSTTVTVRVSDGSSAGSIAFRWTIAGRPRSALGGHRRARSESGDHRATASQDHRRGGR